MTDSDLLCREKARLRIAGALILLLGFASASLVYWIETRSENARLGEYEEAQNRAEVHQLQLLYGKSGDYINALSETLKRPATQAALIAGISLAVALGCFYLGRPLDESDAQR